jgi:hypothetical protein
LLLTVFGKNPALPKIRLLVKFLFTHLIDLFSYFWSTYFSHGHSIEASSIKTFLIHLLSSTETADTKAMTSAAVIMRFVLCNR